MAGNILAGLLGGGVKDAGEGVKAAASGIGALTKDIRTAITGELPPDQKLAAIADILAKVEAGDSSVNEVNKVEAASSSRFVSGWRPAIGWVCVLSLAAYYPPRFVLASYLWTKASLAAGSLLPLPEVGVADILGLVGSMLGVAYLRTAEKAMGVARS
jgi:hypothetical protein